MLSAGGRNRDDRRRHARRDGAPGIRHGCCLPTACPVEVAREVASTGFGGVCVDASAISPETPQTIGEVFDRFVDGGIIALRQSDPERPDSSWRGPTRSSWPTSSVAPGDHCVVRPDGAPSALTVADAAWTKGSTALLMTAALVTERSGIAEELMAWGIGRCRDWPIGLGDTAATQGLALRRRDGADRAAGMAGLPGGFHQAAAEIFGECARLEPGCREPMCGPSGWSGGPYSPRP